MPTIKTTDHTIYAVVDNPVTLFVCCPIGLGDIQSSNPESHSTEAKSNSLLPGLTMAT
ncbi:MAG: hypothetical protein HOM36_01280 [Phycisphaerae bacterium]|nr:hypothetical protein [Phycisphaerae bacterium]